MAATVRAEAQRGSTFRSLRTRNYRLYFSGQLVSMAGTFMQTVAQGWLVLKLTGSTTALGLVLAVQYVPMLVLGPFGGVLVDRADRRKLWMLTQTLAGLCALTLGLLTVAGAIPPLDGLRSRDGTRRCDVHRPDDEDRADPRPGGRGG